MRSLDLTALASGVAIATLGALLLLQEEGAIDLEGGWLLAAVTACTGAALVASGLGARKP
jgi:NhaP-type Na+/H+ or K+/H+ antiporter